MEDAGERVELTPPAGLGERVLEAEGEEHTCSATVTGIGDGTVLARLTVEDFRTALAAEKRKRLQRRIVILSRFVCCPSC